MSDFTPTNRTLKTGTTLETNILTSARYGYSEYMAIVTIVENGFADNVITAAREVGATGATILHARGSGIHETEKFMNTQIQPEKDVVIIVVEKDILRKTMSSITQKAGLATPGRGVSFTLPITDIAGFTVE
ncbi:MAG: P-II family nitrogen regulator [Clostridiales Family XIII bacterium]|jgi:nitrogen regulatory protein PII|nr:P-II family nitrogen regulator [Clostridiales Family XIII bacterium]